MGTSAGTATATATAASAGVLATLAASQFLMTLDSSVMNVSIATVASDIGTDVTGIQTAITLYTLVMASLMITGGKIGSILGRKKAFALGCVIYGVGSFTTSLAPNLAALLIGWSLLEGIGAALIMPAIVALVATNFDRPDRPRSRGSGRDRPDAPRPVRWPSPPDRSSVVRSRPTPRGAGCSRGRWSSSPSSSR